MGLFGLKVWTTVDLFRKQHTVSVSNSEPPSVPCGSPDTHKAQGTTLLPQNSVNSVCRMINLPSYFLLRVNGQVDSGIFLPDKFQSIELRSKSNPIINLSLSKEGYGWGCENIRRK